MHALTNPALRQRLLKPLIVALAAASGAAWADEPSPFYIGGKLGAGRDSNVFRVPDGPHDYFYSTTLLGGFDQKISRQRFYADASADYNRYHNQESLNNTSYALKAGWDWATVENLSGTLFGNASQSLAAFNGNANLPVITNERNLLKTDQFGASVRWGGEGLLTLEGNYAHSRVKYSAPEYLANESSADTAAIGGYYRAGATLRLGIAARGTRTDSPNAIPIIPVGGGAATGYEANKTKGSNLDLLADWRYSEQTAAKLRVSYTRQTNSRSEVQDFSGVTGALSGTYAPTGKLFFDAEIARDAGSNANFYNNVVPATSTTTGTAYGLTQDSQTTDTASVGVRYAATAKISANAGYRYRHAKIRQVVNAGGTAADQTDNLHIVSLGVTYDIARAWQLGCNLAREKRDVSGTPAFAYNATTTSCSVQFLLK